MWYLFWPNITNPCYQCFEFHEDYTHNTTVVSQRYSINGVLFDPNKYWQEDDVVAIGFIIIYTHTDIYYYTWNIQSVPTPVLKLTFMIYTRTADESPCHQCIYRIGKICSQCVNLPYNTISPFCCFKYRVAFFKIMLFNSLPKFIK